MDNKHVLKSLKVNEIERKFTIKNFSKEENWDKEFLIYQWFTENLDNKETKLKIIIDLKTFHKRYVRVTKERVSNEEAKKTVDYLTNEAINFKELIDTPFVCKRRSIKKDIHLDKFIHANGICDFLLEDEANEDDLNAFCKENQINVIEDVTDDINYRNINMAIDFNKNHLYGLKLLQEVF